MDNQVIKLITSKKVMKTVSYYALCFYFPQTMAIGTLIYKCLY